MAGVGSKVKGEESSRGSGRMSARWRNGRVVARVSRVGVRRPLAMLAALTMVATSLAAGAPPAAAASVTVVAQANWGGLPWGSSWPQNGSAASMPGVPAMTVSLSKSTWDIGDIVRVTATLRSGVVKQTKVEGPQDDPTYKHSGATGIDLSLNAQFQRVGYGSSIPDLVPGLFVPGLDMSPLGGGVRFTYVEAVNPPGETNYKFGPGDEFWVDYVATVPSSQVQYPLVTGGVAAFRYDVDSVPQQEFQSMTLWQVAPYVLPDPDLTPTAAFSFVLSESEERTVQFHNESTPAEEGDTLSYEWQLSEHLSTPAENPEHTFPHAGTFPVKLVVTDQNGRTSEVTHDVVIPPKLVVNSTGDRPAVNPTERGCDTGEVVGADMDPECTLRAALETINLGGDGSIVFDLPGDDTPVVDLDSPLPATTGLVTIDGTTQAGGWVGVAATGASALTATDGRLRVRGLTIWGSDSAVVLTGGANHSIKGNRLHTFLGGTMPDVTTGYAVRADNTDHVVIADNLIKGRLGVRIGSDALSTSIHDNQIGDDPNDSFRVTNVAILTGGPSTSIADNLISGKVAGVILDGSTVVNSTVTGNQIVGLDGPASEGVRANGAGKVQISNNQISGWGAGVVISGSDQTTPSGDGISRDLNFDYENPLLGDSVSGSAEVSNNTIGATRIGVVTWAGALAPSVENNTVTAPTAVFVNDATSFSAVGNTFLLSYDGISTAKSDGLFVEHNTFRSTVTAHTTGVRDWQEGSGPRGTVIQRNQFEGASIAVHATSESAEIAGNKVTGALNQGIVALGPNSKIELNTVVSGADGIVAGGMNSVVKRNRVGLTDDDIVAGNSGDGVVVEADNVTLSENLIAGSAGNGVYVKSNSLNTVLRLNRIWSSGNKPIEDLAPSRPPEITGVFMTGTGEEAKTTLVMKGLAETSSSGGIVDVFANDSCGDAEARYFVTSKEYQADVPYLVVSVPGVEFDHFTVIATPNGSGSSSILSDCTAYETPRDADGDGSPDQLEALIDTQNDPRTGVLLTDKDELMFLHLSGNVGRLENVVISADPAPNSHPQGWELRYGAIGFRVTGIDPGSSVRVDLDMAKGETDFDSGMSYWKYGVPASGGSPRWYEFEYDSASGLGGRQGTTLDGRSTFGIYLKDGQTGDYDGTVNGTITDPGGPVVFAGAPPTTTPTTPTTTTVDPGVSTTTSPAASTPSTITPSTGGRQAGVSSGGVKRGTDNASGAAATRTRNDRLSYTGSNSTPALVLGLLLIGLGAGLVYFERRRDHRRTKVS